ncbi:metallophosphoesterase family protein [Sphingomonas sp. ZB1N12]|uniref:metallophosphoesterase family protein n=1 Tax=Sphingomonas arabinosi TaxID=3096160 RepID=UPI002FC95165
MPSTDSGDRIYAIGDIHGRYDLLQMLIARIGEHSASLPPARSLYVVLIGDIVDRGPQSAEVLAMLYSLQRQNSRVIVLLGNHEEAMLQALDGDPDALRRWLAVGGDATLASFGIAPLRVDDDPRDYMNSARRAIPRQWLAWLRQLPLSVQSGDYYFVHAGVRPGVALARQVREDMLWIRREFLRHERDFGAIIVHGHSVTPDVDVRQNRIGIDTGAYRTGVLSAIYLEGEKRDILAVSLPV